MSGLHVDPGDVRNGGRVMVTFRKVTLGSALLICLAQVLPNNALVGCGCIVERSATNPNHEDMRWLTRGLAPAPADETSPILHRLECND